MLFSSVQANDKLLSESAYFRAYITPVLAQCFRSQVAGYIRDIQYYVQPWEKTVLQCTADSYLWHGSDDNWSPASMAHYLNNNLVNCQALELTSELSHYSCLYHAAPRICAQIASIEKINK